MSTPNRKSAKRYKDLEFLSTLGAHCKKLRTQKGFSIDRMAKESERLSTSVIHRLETGSGPVTVLALARYAEVLELHPKQLFAFGFEQIAEPKGAVTVFPHHDRRIRKEAFKTFLPLYSLKAAAGGFGRGESVEPLGWVDASALGKLDKKMFVVQVAGKSMLPKIQDADYVVFRSEPVGTRQGKIVLAQYRGPADPETGGSYTIKKYSSEKAVSGRGEWRHKQIMLSPLNREFKPIVLTPKDEDDFRILAEFVGVLKRGKAVDSD